MTLLISKYLLLTGSAANLVQISVISVLAIRSDLRRDRYEKIIVEDDVALNAQDYLPHFL